MRSAAAAGAPRPLRPEPPSRRALGQWPRGPRTPARRARTPPSHVGMMLSAVPPAAAAAPRPLRVLRHGVPAEQRMRATLRAARYHPACKSSHPSHARAMLSVDPAAAPHRRRPAPLRCRHAPPRRRTVSLSAPSSVPPLPRRRRPRLQAHATSRQSHGLAMLSGAPADAPHLLSRVPRRCRPGRGPPGLRRPHGRSRPSHGRATQNVALAAAARRRSPARLRCRHALLPRRRATRDARAADCLRPPKSSRQSRGRATLSAALVGALRRRSLARLRCRPALPLLLSAPRTARARACLLPRRSSRLSRVRAMRSADQAGAPRRRNPGRLLCLLGLLRLAPAA